jgi:hypothetical protein
MRSDPYERIHKLTALRKRAGEITRQIQREADLLADVHHELADVLAAIGSERTSRVCEAACYVVRTA